MLISEEYKKEQEKLHKNANYGVASVSYAPLVTDLINQLQVSEMLDYGAGKGRLGMTIKPDVALKIDHYEPCNNDNPDWAESPVPREFVCCIDVLEHVEPNLINDVLDDLRRVTKAFGFFTVHTGPAAKFLSDGRNAHLIQKDYKWWLPKIWSRFNLISYSNSPGGFYVVVSNVN